MSEEQNQQQTETEERESSGVKESVHKVWLAGLGAVAVAEEEGSKLFTHLVEKGEAFEDRGKERFGEAKERAGQGWEKLGGKFDERVAAALERLGFPKREEITQLRQRVDDLTAKLEELRPGQASETAS